MGGKWAHPLFHAARNAAGLGVLHFERPWLNTARGALGPPYVPASMPGERSPERLPQCCANHQEILGGISVD